MKKIAHFGAYDHDSYGDLLFPHIAEHLWPEFDITHVAPTNIATDWSDAKPILGVEEAIHRTDWDGILVGGGDIIQNGDWVAPKWEQNLEVPCSGFPSLWVGASFLAAKLNIPVAWNAPGVPVSFPEFFASTAGLALSCADYVSVRDGRSLENLAMYAQNPIEIVADTALAVARLWPVEEKRSHIVMSLSKIDIQLHSVEIQKAIEQLRNQFSLGSEDIVILPLMRWEFEGDTLEDTIRQSGIDARVVSGESLESIARLIGSSSGYIGNSLHGLITALSYGVPSVLVVPGHNKASQKYAGFLDAAGCSISEHLAMDWTRAAENLFYQANIQIKPEIIAHLDGHRQRVGVVLGGNTTDKRELWDQISSQVHKDCDRMALSGLMPVYFCDLCQGKKVALSARVEELSSSVITLNTVMTEREEQAKALGGMVEDRDNQLEHAVERMQALEGMVEDRKNQLEHAVLRTQALEGMVEDQNAQRERATLRAQALEGTLQAWHQSVFGRLAKTVDYLLEWAYLPVRLGRYLLNPVLRERARNSLRRHIPAPCIPRKSVCLPDLDWLLGKLDLKVPVDQVMAKIGAYITPQEEASYGSMIGALRAAGEGVPSTVQRPAELMEGIENSKTRKRILFVCGEFPDPVHGGGGRVADFIKALSVDHDVYVAAWYDRRRDHEAFVKLAPYCQCLHGLSFEDLEAGCVDQLLDVIGQEPVDIVHYEWPRSLNSFDRRLGHHHIYTHMEVVSCSLWMDLCRMEPLSSDWLQRLAQLMATLQVEALDAGQVDAQLVVTAKDGKFLSRFVGGKSYYVVNHGINRDEFDLPEQPSEPNTLVFTGNFIHYPNLDAMHYFMKEIRPIILKSIPDFHMWMVGIHPPAELKRYHDGQGVFVTGRVPDVRPYIQKATVCIAPLISGAGLRTKVVQYAALRRPSVVTPIAAEDLGFEDGREVCIADQPEAFASRVVELLQNPSLAREIADRARKRAMDCYDNTLIAKRDLGGLYSLLDEEERS